MSKGLLSKSYPEKTPNRRIKSAPSVIVSPPHNLGISNPILSTTETKEITEMLQKPTSVSVSRSTNITLKALGSLGYGDTIDETIEVLVQLLTNSFSSDERGTLDHLVNSFKNFEIINLEKKKKNEHRNRK